MSERSGEPVAAKDLKPGQRVLIRFGADEQQPFHQEFVILSVTTMTALDTGDAATGLWLSDGFQKIHVRVPPDALIEVLRE